MKTRMKLKDLQQCQHHDSATTLDMRCRNTASVTAAGLDATGGSRRHQEASKTSLRTAVFPPIDQG